MTEDVRARTKTVAGVDPGASLGVVETAATGDSARAADVPRLIDSHLHLWDLRHGGYAWLGPEHGELYRSFGPDEAHAALLRSGFDAAVLVQADDTLDDTRFMLELAEANDWIVGVVGWVPLDDPDAAERALEEWARHPVVRGIRHLVHEDPRDDVLELPTVRRSLHMVARAGLAFDVPDAWPRHLARARRVAEDIPDLTVVIDHLAKPPRGDPGRGEGFDAWAAELRRVAALPNTVAKVSGLRMPGVPFTVEALRPAWRVALDAFGPERLLYGGDWPMTVPAGGYAPTWAVMDELFRELSRAERSAILGGNAMRVYRLVE